MIGERSQVMPLPQKPVDVQLGKYWKDHGKLCFDLYHAVIVTYVVYRVYTDVLIKKANILCALQLV